MMQQFQLEKAAPRLDIFLATASGLSRGKIRKIIDFGGVHVDGRRVRRLSFPLRAGQKVEIFLDDLPLIPFRLSEEYIVFEDSHLIVINKPAGILTQPTPARLKGTLFEALERHLREQGVGKPSIAMHQPLDVGTTGLLTFSIHETAHRGMTQQEEEHVLQHTYLALVEGRPEPASGTIQTQIARRNKRTLSVESGGKEAITHYELVQETAEPEGASFSLLRIRLETGHSHQIRAHLSEQNHPLLGDSFYGGKMSAAGQQLTRPLLHSSRLELHHPVSQEALHFEVPLPTDMAALLLPSPPQE
ncbi:MAG: RluA family pseudouridine synthase [Desulforhopalus sp.]|nr:RluA family pseudouridine synthase [Desulforhopalus sp.]